MATNDKDRVARVPTWWKSIKFIDGYENDESNFYFPYKYHFADDALQENVDNFTKNM